MGTVFDHIAVGAADLAKGQAWARAALGVEIPDGGAHPLMSTHNLLARLPVGYFEIIAVDPAAPPPGRARWYGLDDPDVQARLSAGPAPVSWVLGVEDLDAAMTAAAWETGPALEVTRGELSWRLTVPEDGSIPERVLPTLIEWPDGPPVGRMRDVGLSLSRLTLAHPEPARIRDCLASVDAADLGVEISVVDGAPRLGATLQGPGGVAEI